MDAVFQESSKDAWALLKNVLNLAVQLIKPCTGKYLTHFNGKSVTRMIPEYELILSKLFVPKSDLKSSFTRSESFVPGFQETWLFYQLSMIQENK